MVKTLITLHIGQGTGAGEGGFWYCIYKNDGLTPGDAIYGAGTYPTLDALLEEAKPQYERTVEEYGQEEETERTT